MPIQDSDLFLIEDGNGDSKKVTAANLLANCEGSYANHKLLVNDSSYNSYWMYASDIKVKMEESDTRWMLVERSGVPYRVENTLLSDYFPNALPGWYGDDGNGNAVALSDPTYNLDPRSGRIDTNLPNEVWISGISPMDGKPWGFYRGGDNSNVKAYTSSDTELATWDERGPSSWSNSTGSYGTRLHFSGTRTYLIGTQGGFNSQNYTYVINASGSYSNIGAQSGLEEQCGSIYKPGSDEIILGAGYDTNYYASGYNYSSNGTSFGRYLTNQRHTDWYYTNAYKNQYVCFANGIYAHGRWIMCARQQEMSGSQKNYRDLMWSGTSPTSMSRHIVSDTNQVQPDGTYATINNVHGSQYNSNSTSFHIEMNPTTGRIIAMPGKFIQSDSTGNHYGAWGYWSDNGSTWHLYKGPNNSEAIKGLAYGNGQWVMMDSEAYYVSNDDAASWTRTTWDNVTNNHVWNDSFSDRPEGNIWYSPHAGKFILSPNDGSITRFWYASRF